jgi:tripartite-type tricarboxylate transporter receptor subunit TctC
MARLFASQLNTRLGWTVLVENRAGGDFFPSTLALTQSPADGLTVYQMPAGLTLLPALRNDLPWDLKRDILPLVRAVNIPLLLAAPMSLPTNHLQEFIAYAKANPGKLSYGTPGVGTPQHIAGELFCFLAGIKMEHIPYRGANMADLMSGVVQVGIQNAGAAMPLVRDGRVRGIAVTSLKRTPSAPDLPTLAEQGFPGFEATSWFALLGPANLPRPIVDKVRAESLKVLADKEMEKKFSAMGLDLVGSTPEETAAAIAADIPKWAKVIRDANIKTGN